MTFVFIPVFIASPVTARSCPGNWGDGAMRAVYGLMRSIQPPEPRSGHCMLWMGSGAGDSELGESDSSQACAVAPVGRASRLVTVAQCDRFWVLGFGGDGEVCVGRGERGGSLHLPDSV